jgi:metal transporter CNNM
VFSRGDIFSLLYRSRLLFFAGSQQGHACGDVLIFELKGLLMKILLFCVNFFKHSFLIVIFGEIVPQAACQRYSLEVGSLMVPVVRVIMVLLLPVSYPLSKGLDYALGEELATTYSSSEMIKLLQIHVHEQVMDPETATAMQGALKYKDMSVKEVMTPLTNVFMLSAEERLNFETIAKIFKTGYSRIPVYSVSKVRFSVFCLLFVLVERSFLFLYLFGLMNHVFFRCFSFY